MRLNCPNCNAQYEVPDDVIPAEGRDVQCSNCGNTWFQLAAGAGQVPEADPAHQSATPAPQPAPEPEPEPEPAPELPPQPAPKPRELDPEVASVLREEAAREARVRESERGAVESQPDLGLDDMSGPEDEEDLRARQSRERMARLRGEDPDVPDVAAAAAAASGSRRELLPDIEEINSTLRSTDQPRQSEASEEIAAEPERKARSGFRRGFLTVLLIAVIALAVYIYAPQIAETFPGLSEALAGYVNSVDQLRTWLDGKVLAGLQLLDGMAAENQPAAAE